MTTGTKVVADFLQLLMANHPELDRAGFAHVANVGSIQADVPYDLADGIQLRKANANEIASLKSIMQLMLSTLEAIPTRNPYETTVQAEPADKSISYLTTNLDEERWRYHVIAFQGSNSTVEEIVDSSALTRTRLQLGPTVFCMPWTNGPGFVGGSALTRLWDDLSHSDEPLLLMNVSQLNELREVHAKFSNFVHDQVPIREFVRRFVQLDRIPRESPLRFLGYVSILESIITHAPDSKDPYDSLTRQVCQKMLLIGRRSTISIPYELFDSGAKRDSIWKRLYAYRSAIAHGTKPDFEKGLQCLKNPTTALQFIESATVAVMRQALEEPDLIADLRAC